jgi:uncharacterized protein (DUF433 family)
MNREKHQIGPSDLRFEAPLYTVAEAARALDVPAATFSTWAKGYIRHPPGRSIVEGAAVLTADIQAKPGSPAVPFVGLAEGMVLAAVRRAGVPMQRIRPALRILSEQLGIQHALASRRLFTDGAELLFDFADRSTDPDVRLALDLVVLRSGQRVFTEIVESYLRRIEYASDGYAERVRLPAYSHAEVVADPTRSYGQPIFARGGARVSDVLERFWAGEELDAICAEFGVPSDELEDVLRVASRRAA